MKKNCLQCNKEFNAKRSILKFCDRKCSAIWRCKNYPLAKTCFKKGHKSWNSGTNKSGMAGKKHSRITKDKMRNAHLGEKSYRWTGKSEENFRLRRSSKYADWRKAVFQRDNYTCQICKARSMKGIKVVLEADHIKQFALYPELRFDLNNGRTLCAPCHRKTDTWGVRKQAMLESTNQTFNEVSNGKDRTPALDT